MADGVSYESREALAGKISWEGGLWEWATGYGFNPSDMPDEETTEAAVHFRAHLDIAGFYAPRFLRLLPDVE